MNHYDVFNGDADGICALIQMRLDQPCFSELVTGVKRDIALLERLEVTASDEVLVLDISLDSNRAGLERVLATGARVRYFDHHHAGEIPTADNLEAHIDPAPETCTCMLVDAAVNGRHRLWATVGAFGDNLATTARHAAERMALPEEDLIGLERLGICLNYNGYGATVEDLHFHPADLFRRLIAYADPRDVLADQSSPFHTLDAGYREDFARADAAERLSASEHAAAFLLPDEPWARRVSGVWSNALANDHPDRAHAVITPGTDGWRISIRAPLHRRSGADELARRWPTGGGRSAAAGINALPEAELDAFLADFSGHWA
jgi:hypothetical protein